MGYTGVKYVEIILSRDLSELAELNLSPLLNKVAAQLAHWKNYTLSWFGRIVVIKMMILPKIYFFQTMLFSIPLHILDKLQINHFIWALRKPRIKTPILQLPVEKGRAVVPNLRYYFYAAQILAVMQW